MSLFKCKMCGGNVEFENGATVGICDSCGTKQTLPRLDDEKRANLYDRANHFRRNNEFDKAMGIYEQILSEDNTDSEAYWSLVLCRYGIEYVEDPATHKRVPTVNRAQFTSIFADEDYKSALQYADGYQKEIYEQEAKAIDEIQKGILAISQKEEPFDVFICYKETDKDGRRTQDSVLANDLYHQLTQEGFKVFFSRITLEDKLGTAYEPYIFAALNSAKVMVVLGTKPEYFNAVWVKNEWSRYLTLVKQSGGKKILIPAYRDMDPYDLPDDFSHLQAQDMSKLGFMQDLIRGIRKIISADEPKPTVIKETVISDVNTDTSPLLKRAFMFLEDKNWQEADEYCEKVLDRNPECAEAYLGKLMAELQVCKIEELADCDEPFDSNNNYQKAVRFADNNLANTFKHINECNKNARLEKIYAGAVKAMEFANTQSEFEIAAQKFEEIAEYKDSSDLIEKCREEAENKRKDDIYNSALATIKTTYDKIAGYEAAVEMFESISGWKDADEQILICQRKIEEIKAKKEAECLEAERKAEERRIKAEKTAKKLKKIIAITTPIICVCIAFLLVLFNIIIPTMKYNSANKCVESKKYLDAIALYEELTDYKDSASKIKSTRYLLAISQLENKEYKNAYDNFTLIKDYKDSAAKRQESGYFYAQTLMNDKKYQEAADILERIVSYDGKNIAIKNQCYLECAKQFYANKEYYNAISWYEKVMSYDKNAEFYLDSCYNYGKSQLSSGNYIAAITWFSKCANYSDTQAQIKETKYQYIKSNMSNSSATTFEYMKELKSAGYKDSASIYKDLYAWKVTVIAVNSDTEDETTNKSSISKYDPIIFHYKLTGGAPNDKTIVNFKTYDPNGNTTNTKSQGTMYDGATSWFGFENGIYENPAYGKGGKLTVKFYDSSNNFIGEGSVNITS